MSLRTPDHRHAGLSSPTCSPSGERMPVYVHVIDHPDGRVLVDTGMTELHPAVADMDPRLSPLSEQDFDLAGIDMVVNTHLHFDHCGGNHLFAGKPIYVQRQELDDARNEDDYTIREWVDAPGVHYVPVDGELELLPGIRLVPAPGHTRGTQIVVVETGEHPVVIAGDVGGLVRRTRRAAYRRPATGACPRPRTGLARPRARALATPTRLRRHPASSRHPAGYRRSPSCDRRNDLLQVRCLLGRLPQPRARPELTRLGTADRSSTFTPLPKKFDSRRSRSVVISEAVIPGQLRVICACKGVAAQMNPDARRVRNVALPALPGDDAIGVSARARRPPPRRRGVGFR